VPPAAPLQAPAAVRRIELAGEPADLDLRRAGQPYRSALLVATLHGRPLGTCNVTLDASGLSGADARAAIVGALDVPREGAAAPRRVLPSVSVVVATCGADEAVARTVASVLRCDPRAHEVIVVENRPAGSTVAATLAERFAGDGRVRCVREPRQGLSWARNAGIAVATGEILAFTDDDVEVEPDWAGAIARAFADEPSAACVTGLILPAELETAAQLVVEQYASWGKGYRRRVFRPDEPTGPLFPYAAGEFGSGANTALRVDFARATGGFDPALGVGTIACGSEDLDVYVRTLLAGRAIVYEPAAMVWHRSPDTGSQVRSEVFRYGVSMAAVLTKLATHGHAWPIARRVPAGLRFLRDPGSRKNAGKRREYPRRLDWIEYAGMALGPLAYAESRRRTSRMVR
jgi:GT2 family glycosyltransferase